MEHVRGDVDVVAAAGEAGKEVDEEFVDARVPKATKHIDEPIGVVPARDVFEFEVVRREAFDEVELGAVVALEPGEDVQLEATHRHREAPFARLLRAALVQPAAEVGFVAARQEIRRHLAHFAGHDRVLAVDHAGLHAGQVADPEAAHGAPTTVQHVVGCDHDALRTTEEKVGPLQPGCREREGGELCPQRVDIPTPDHVGVDEQGPVEGREFVQVMLESNDGLMFFRKVRDVVEQCVQVVCLERFNVAGRAIQCNRPVGIVATQRQYRSNCIANISIWAICVVNVSFDCGHQILLLRPCAFKHHTYAELVLWFSRIASYCGLTLLGRIHFLQSLVEVLHQCVKTTLANIGLK